MSTGLNLPFLKIFSDCRPEGRLGRLLEGCTVREMAIDSGRRELRLTLSFSDAGPGPEQFLSELETALKEVYGLAGASISFDGGGSESDEEAREPVWEETKAEEIPEPEDTAPCCCARVEKSWDENGGEENDFDADLRRTEEIRMAALREMNLSVPVEKKAGKKSAGKALMGKAVKKEPVPMGEVSLDSPQVVVRGHVFAVNHREMKRKGAWVICFDMTDYTGSVRISKFMPGGEAAQLAETIVPGIYLGVEARPVFNRFENEMTLEPVNIFPCEAPVRKDASGEKRVELHLHTRMSAMDGLTETKKAVQRAIDWGHPAIAITDHGVVQSFPDAAKAAKGKPIKILYGTEAYCWTTSTR
jgi:DNA polymerase-3 subunit alpha (Gram-positive type)